MARNHRAGGQVEPHVARMGELLQGRNRQQGVPSDRQLHRCAVAPVVAYQAQGQATQGRDLSTLAPLRVLRTRTLNCAWARRVVGEGVKVLSESRMQEICPSWFDERDVETESWSNY